MRLPEAAAAAGNKPNGSSAAAASAATASAAAPDLGPQVTLEEELRQEWAFEETLLRQKKEADAAAKRQIEEAANKRAAAREAESAAKEELRVRPSLSVACFCILGVPVDLFAAAAAERQNSQEY